jgi:hypothetical protein
MADMRTWILYLRCLAFLRRPGKISLANIPVVCARPCQTTCLEPRNVRKDPSCHTPHAMHLRNANAGRVCRPPRGAILGVTRPWAGNVLGFPPLTFCPAAATLAANAPVVAHGFHTLHTAGGLTGKGDPGRFGAVIGRRIVTHTEQRQVSDCWPPVPTPVLVSLPPGSAESTHGEP